MLQQDLPDSAGGSAGAVDLLAVVGLHGQYVIVLERTKEPGGPFDDLEVEIEAQRKVGGVDAGRPLLFHHPSGQRQVPIPSRGAHHQRLSQFGHAPQVGQGRRRLTELDAHLSAVEVRLPDPGCSPPGPGGSHPGDDLVTPLQGPLLDRPAHFAITDERYFHGASGRADWATILPEEAGRPAAESGRWGHRLVSRSIILSYMDKQDGQDEESGDPVYLVYQCSLMQQTGLTGHGPYTRKAIRVRCFALE